jgi:hypothetical protein
MAKENEGSTMEQEALKNGNAAATPAPTPTAKETDIMETVTKPITDVNTQKVAPTDATEATALMKKMNITKLWRTLVDGYWFSVERLAKEHLKKVGGVIRMYENTDKK